MKAKVDKTTRKHKQIMSCLHWLTYQKKMRKLYFNQDQVMLSLLTNMRKEFI